jgi:hypothetical protein
MRTVMVRYTLKPASVADNEALIADVFAQIAREKPAGVRYQVFKLPDGVGMVHLATSEAEVNPVTLLDAFQRYTAGIRDRCQEPPVNQRLQVLGEYDSLR